MSIDLIQFLLDSYLFADKLAVYLFNFMALWRMKLFMVFFLREDYEKDFISCYSIAEYGSFSCGRGGKKQEKKLGITYEEQYHSKWLSKGVEAYGQQGAFFEIIDLDLYSSGFGLQVIHRHATSDYVNKQRFDYRPYVKGEFFKEKPYAMKYDIGVEYEHYPRLATHKSYTSYEWQFGFSWPNILPKGFVPSYIAHYEYPVKHNQRLNFTGWVHRFELDYYMDVPQLPKPLCLSSGSRLHLRPWRGLTRLVVFYLWFGNRI